ncbi:methyltransferase domain-containing protein [Streptomyces sp. NPDC086783]|uniref:methyltransferase domain-containing protein n=1 Tax=Streptomyces sp. NPDC086783 TaxID=3365758 RepID=UPI00381471B3
MQCTQEAAQKAATYYQAVDSLGGHFAVAQALNAMSRNPSFKIYKEYLSACLLREGPRSLLDIGCGLGTDLLDAQNLASGLKVLLGLDPSVQLLKTAEKRKEKQDSKGVAVGLVAGDALQLPVGNDKIDAIRVDRCLQHVDAPSIVMRECYRCINPTEGVIVCAEPDWSTFAISHGNDQLASEWPSNILNRDIAQQLPRLITDSGFQITNHRRFRVEVAGLRDLSVIFGLSSAMLGDEPHVAATLDILVISATCSS